MTNFGSRECNAGEYFCGTRKIFALNYEFEKTNATAVYKLLFSAGLGLKILVARRQRGPTHNYKAII
jgi:hypothetical protein